MPGFFRQLVSEVRRRRIVPVVAAYAVSAWLILQIAEVTFEPLGLPVWTIRFLIVAAVAGFPAVFLLAWLIDFQERGMMFDLPLWRGGTDVTPDQAKSSQLLAALLCVITVVGTYALVIYVIEQFPAELEPVAEEAGSDYPPNSIAVLAFENFDGGADSDYFAAGLSEEILNFLAALKELSVAARTSSFRFRGEQIDIREVARLLNVKHVLEGSVRREGNRIRVTAQLIDGVEGYHDWSKTYDRDLDDIFAIQTEIAAAVVNELKIALSVDSETLLQDVQKENIDAYIFYLQGRERLRSSNDSDVVTTAKQLFNQALEVDPSSSRAYAGICESNLRLYEISNNIDDFLSAEQACDKARGLNPGLNTEVQIALGRLYRYRGWYDKAEAELNAVIATSSAAVDAYIELGEVYVAQNNNVAAEAMFLRAIDLKRNYWKAYEALAGFYYEAERYSESVEAYETVTSLTPDVAAAFAGKGAAYWMLGDTQRAQTALDRSLQLKPTRAAYTNLGLVYYYAGQFDASADMQEKALEYAPDDHRIWGRLAESYRFVEGRESESHAAYENAAEFALKNLEINSEDWPTTGLLGLYYTHLGRVDEGLSLLELAAEQSEGDPNILYIRALALLKAGDRERALDLLQQAIAAEGQYRQLIATDPDLLVLGQDERFIALLSRNSSPG